MKLNVLAALAFFVTLISVLFVPQITIAIDNPDTRNRIAEFEERERPYQIKAQKQLASYDITTAYANYEKFLDQELNDSYQLILNKIKKEDRDRLILTQREWIRFRDAEFLFISQIWTRDRFGSSFAISRGDNRTSVIRNRVIQLLHYSKNF